MGFQYANEKITREDGVYEYRSIQYTKTDARHLGSLRLYTRAMQRKKRHPYPNIITNETIEVRADREGRIGK